MKIGVDSLAPPAKKTMRVATTLTGVTMCAVAFAPAATAHAATNATHAAKPDSGLVDLGPAGKTVKKALKVHMPAFAAERADAATPDTNVPDQPFSMAMFIHGVSRIQVCGWHPANQWRCTESNTGLLKSHSYYWGDIGGNIRSWDRGTVDVYWNGGGAGKWDTCNTNGNYLGFLSSPHWLVLGYSSSRIGPGHPKC